MRSPGSRQFERLPLDIEFSPNLHGLETTYGPVSAGVLTRAGWISNPGGHTFLPAGTHSRRETQLTRRLLAHQLQRSVEDFRVLHQIHGTTIVRRGSAIEDSEIVRRMAATGSPPGGVTRFRSERLPEADGQFTTVAGLVLVVNVADCCPVLIVSPQPAIAGIVHAGWRGAAEGIATALVSRMAAEGAPVSGLHAWVGPCAERSHYEVGEEVAARFAAYPEALLPHLLDTTKQFLDVSVVLRRQLRTAGIVSENIETSNGGTISDQRYHSHRRASFSAGRMAAFLSL